MTVFQNTRIFRQLKLWPFVYRDVPKFPQSYQNKQRTNEKPNQVNEPIGCEQNALFSCFYYTRCITRSSLTTATPTTIMHRDKRPNSPFKQAPTEPNYTFDLNRTREN